MQAYRCIRLCFVILILLNGVEGAWKYTTRKSARKQAQKYQSDAATYGPNVCAVQEVFRTGEKFYPDCVRKRLRKVCGQPTFVRYECCCGYGVLDGEEGCPTADPLQNVHKTLLRHGLNKFATQMTNTELEYNLKEAGAFTVFAPTDEAFDLLTHDQKQRLFPWTYNALSLLHYHVAPGWHHSDYMGKRQFLPTMYYGLKPVWINRQSKNNLHTVNCARIIRSNILASNGVIHIIDKVISPYDMLGNLTELLFRDSSQFSQFIQVLYTAQMFAKVRSEGPYTLFVPSNYAFSRLPPTLLKKILRDKKLAEAVVNHHTSKGVYCSTAVMENTKVKMLDGASMRFQCKKSGHYLHNSKIIGPDIIAGNGVIHIVNKLQLPHSIQTMDTLARELNLNKFLRLCYDGGLLDKLETGSEMTMFIPSDEAFNNLPKHRKNAIFSDPILFESIFDYHTTNGIIRTDSFIGEHGVLMNSGVTLKINVHRNGILVDDAEIISPNKECSNGVIHVIDRVLTPPTRTLLDAILDTEDLSIFYKGLEKSNLEEMFERSDQMYTVFAPSDEAFQKLPTWKFDDIFNNRDKLRMVMKNHAVEGVFISRSIAPDSLIQLQSVQGDTLLFRRNKHNQYNVNKYSDLLASVVATNGVLYKVDRMLDCDCEPAEKATATANRSVDSGKDNMEAIVKDIVKENVKEPAKDKVNGSMKPSVKDNFKDAVKLSLRESSKDKLKASFKDRTSELKISGSSSDTKPS